jgi:alpha-L-arabinofuranosidase
VKNVRVLIDKEFLIAPVDRRLNSSFVEHLGRCVYTGIYEPGHPDADEQGFRKDVLALVRDLNIPLIRYPGGNFVSGYTWTDGIGPKSQRPVRLDLAWKTKEPNTVGIDEFYDWTKKAGTAILGAINMGTGTPKEAGDFVEYCNFPSGTYWSDLRQKNGHKDPYNIHTWCIGNEMDGPWQICHLDADDYGKKATETAKIVKWIDSKAEVVISGSSSPGMSTFPEWDRKVLEHTYEQADYISLHRYYENHGNDTDFLSSFADMDAFIKTVCTTADYVKALKRSKKTINLSFDEWNVWYMQNQQDHDWMYAPPILEDHYSLLDALVVGGMEITLLNNADRVKIACLAQLVNVIAPIFTKEGGPAIRQTIYYPFQDMSLYSHGTVLQPVIKASLHETIYGDIPAAATAVIYDKDEQTVTVFALNTNLDEKTELTLDMRSFSSVSMIYRTVLTGTNLRAVNTIETPSAVKPADVPLEKGTFDTCSLILDPASWNVIRFKVNN